MTAEQTEVVEPQTFYSTCKGLALHAALGKKVMSDGEVVRMGEKIVEFTALNAEHGSYTTDDPEVIAFLHRRVEKIGDVMTAAQYNDSIIPDKMKVDMLRDQNSSQSRLIEEQNRLIASLKAAQTTKVPVPVKQ